MYDVNFSCINLLILSLFALTCSESINRNLVFELHFEKNDIKKAQAASDYFPEHFFIDVKFEDYERKLIKYTKNSIESEECNFGYCIFETNIKTDIIKRKFSQRVNENVRSFTFFKKIYSDKLS